MFIFFALWFCFGCLVVFRGYWFVVHRRFFAGVPSTSVSDAGGGDGATVVFVLVGVDL
jgi:hypothetical protein